MFIIINIFFEAKLCQGGFFVAQTVKGIMLANLSDVVILFLKACEDRESSSSSSSSERALLCC